MEAYILKILQIDKNSENQRLDKYLLKYFNKASKSFIYKMLRKKRIKLNSKKAVGNEILKSNDLIQLYLSSETIDSFTEIKNIQKTEFSFSIIYEDENIIICNKPVGISVQKDSLSEISLNDQLLFYLYQKGEYLPQKDSVFTPSICNRLDKNTSGIVLFGKNFKALQSLNYIIKNKKIDKFYITILNGVINEKGSIEAFHYKDEKNNKSEISYEFKEGCKKIITYYERIAQNGNFSLVKVNIITGKSHQIRAGFNFLGHSVVGDRKYGDYKINSLFKKNYCLDSQFLHSYKIILNDDGGFFDYLQKREFVAHLTEKNKNLIYDLFGLKESDIFEKY